MWVIAGAHTHPDSLSHSLPSPPLLMSIVWYIVGIIIIVVGSVEFFLAALSNPGYFADPAVFLRSFAGALVAIIIGGAVIYLGGIATLLKYSAELVADEVEEVRAYSESVTSRPIEVHQDSLLAAAKSLGILTEGKTREELAKEILDRTTGKQTISP